MRVAICGPNLLDQRKGDMHVHSADCADLRKYGPGHRPYGGEEPWVIEVENTGEVATAVYPPEDFCYDADNPDELAGFEASFHFAPCCKGLAGAH